MLSALRNRLASHLASPLARHRVVLQSPQATHIKVAGSNYLSFASNDYLGLASHPQIIAALQQGARLWGLGSGSADLVTGHTQVHQDLEQALAAATGREKALLFSSGYQANLALISTLATNTTSVIQDRLNHASLLDGCKLAGAKLHRYQHTSLASLQLKLARQPEASLVVTDAVFSMDGTLAPLVEISQLVNSQPNTTLLVDDAHGFGVLGPQGAGSLASLGLSQQQAPALMCTLGKALGSSGAFVAGSAELINSLIQFARPYIYSTSSSPAVAYATLTSLRLMQQEEGLRNQLQELIHQFRSQAQTLDLPFAPSSTAIQPLIVGDASLAVLLAERLRKLGIWVTAIRPPTVPQGTARLRITLSATHSQQDIQQLLTSLRQLLNMPDFAHLQLNATRTKPAVQQSNHA